MNEKYNKKSCFVVSPIGDPNTQIRKNADQLFNHIIQPVCEECGYNAVRIDQENLPGSITQSILDLLRDSDLVIADLSEHNPNVFYEVGYRSALNKPIIHLKNKQCAIPFDIAAIRTFEYDLTDLDSVDMVKRKLQDTINNIPIGKDEKGIKQNEEVQTTNLIEQVLYKLDGLYELMDVNNNKVMEMLNEKIQPAESIETQMLKLILPELMRNPKSADSLIELSEKFKNK